MRFCTTHRACWAGVDFCEVVAAAWTHAEDLDPCTLVDALIIEKVDGEWPEWAVTVMSAELEGDDDEMVATVEAMLDALAQSKVAE